MSDQPVAAGKSSFDLIEAGKAFEIMDVKPGSSFLDLACGIGKYSVAIANYIGEKGTVYAVDLWREGVEALNREIAVKRIKNIKTILADISAELPLEGNSSDACLLATILHDQSFRREEKQDVPGIAAVVARSIVNFPD